MNTLIITDLEMSLELDRDALKGLSGGRNGQKHYKGYKGGYKGYKGYDYGYSYKQYYKEEYFSYGCFAPKRYCFAPTFFYGYGGYGC